MKFKLEIKIWNWNLKFNLEIETWNWTQFGPFFAIFWSFRAIFGVGVRFKYFFGTYLCRQSTLVLEVKPYLFVFNLATIGAFVWLFEPFGGICGVWVRSQIFFGTYLCRQSTLVLEVKPYLFVFILTTFGASFSFFLVLQGYLFGPLRLTLGSGSGSKKLFGTY